jgi:hypothetical protein
VVTCSTLADDEHIWKCDEITKDCYWCQRKPVYIQTVDVNEAGTALHVSEGIRTQFFPFLAHIDLVVHWTNYMH